MALQGKDIEKRLLSVDELALYIGFPKGTIYNWVSERKIEYIKLGKHLRFDKAYIDQWIEEHKQSSNEENSLAR